nr:hypothetical protein [Saprospiraceae bacterium]
AKLSNKFKIVEYPYIYKDPFQEVIAGLMASNKEDEDATLLTDFGFIGKLFKNKEYKFFKVIAEGKRQNLIQARIPFELQN